jgi:hypothetical protein
VCAASPTNGRPDESLAKPKEQPMFSRLRHIRKMTYAIWAWVTLIVVWIAAGASSIHSQTAKCVHQGALDHATCANAVGAGSGIAIFAIVILGFMGFVVLSLVWFMTRPKQRPAAA